MSRPLVLYSTTTRSAFSVAQRYYREKHYVWCAPARPDLFGFTNPPSSDPIQIYRRFKADIQGGDQHSAAIAANRVGIMSGADAKFHANVIEARERDLIKEIVTAARLSDFSPLFLVIPFEGVVSFAELVPVAERASPTSEEYRIEQLDRSLFDVLELV